MYQQMQLITFLLPFLLLGCTEASRFSTANTTSTCQVPVLLWKVLTNLKTSEFAVNGSFIPDVSFEAGESYAGSLPLGNDTNSNLFFWFWPTTDLTPREEIVIWLNGGVRTFQLKQARPVSIHFRKLIIA